MAAMRRPDETARGMSAPVRTCSPAVAQFNAPMLILPARRSTTAALPPRYGTCTSLMASLAARYSTMMLPTVPVPDDTYCRPSFGGASPRALAARSNCASERMPKAGCASSTLGAPPTYAMWVKSRTGSKPGLLLSAGASTCDDIPALIKV